MATEPGHCTHSTSWPVSGQRGQPRTREAPGRAGHGRAGHHWMRLL